VRAGLRDELTAAIKARDRVAVAALRSALAAIANAEAVPVDGLGAVEVERRHLTEADLRSIVVAEVRDRLAAATGYEERGRADVAERLRAEAEVLRRHLR
jgi:uncharacterized protein